MREKFEIFVNLKESFGDHFVVVSFIQHFPSLHCIFLDVESVFHETLFIEVLNEFDEFDNLSSLSIGVARSMSGCTFDDVLSVLSTQSFPPSNLT